MKQSKEYAKTCILPLSYDSGFCRSAENLCCIKSHKIFQKFKLPIEERNRIWQTFFAWLTTGAVYNSMCGIFIDNCSVIGKINATTSDSFARAGGLGASVLRGAVTNSWADVDINAVTDTNHVYAGGLYGMDNRVTTINCYATGDVVSLKTTTDVGILNGRSGGITIDYNCCYNSEAVLKQGDTVV